MLNASRAQRARSQSGTVFSTMRGMTSSAGEAADVTSKLQVTTPTAGDSVVARLRLFDAATERQRAPEAGPDRKPAWERGWRREPLYDRVRRRRSLTPFL
jgi:hypothetical protein